MKLLLVVLLSGCALSAPHHSKRDVSHLLPPATSYGVPHTRIITGPYPPAVHEPVQEYGPPHDEPVAPSNEYGPPPNDTPHEYLPPPPPPAVPRLPEIVVTHPYPPPAEPVQEYGPPQHDVVAPVDQYGPPAEAAHDSVAVGPYPPPVFDSRYGAPTH